MWQFWWYFGNFPYWQPFFTKTGAPTWNFIENSFFSRLFIRTIFAINLAGTEWVLKTWLKNVPSPWPLVTLAFTVYSQFNSSVYYCFSFWFCYIFPIIKTCYYIKGDQYRELLLVDVNFGWFLWTYRCYYTTL